MKVSCNLLILSLFFVIASCSGKKYTKNDGEVVFSTSTDLQVDPRLLGVEIESPAVVENTCWLTTDFDYANAGLSMESYSKIDASDYKKYFSRSGKYDFYLHPIICENEVFDVKNNGEIVAYSLNDGKVKKIWSEKVLSRKEKKNLLFLQARLDGKMLYIASNNGYVVVFDIDKKEILWKKNFNSVFGGSPSVSDDKIFLISATDELYAINKDNGEVAWKYQNEDKLSITSMQIPPVAIYRGKIVAGFAGGSVAVFSQNGELLWKNKLANSKDSTNIVDINDIDFPPMLFQNVLVAGGIRTSIMGFDFESGQPLWQIQSGLNSFMLHNSQGFGFFINGNNENICFHIPSGSIRWVKSENPVVKKVEIAGYLNAGDANAVMNINRYYDAY